MIFQIGVNGFIHSQWRGDFYPSILSERDMLVYYANRLGAVEIETSFLRMPSATTLDKWVYETPDSFRFALQVPRRITHQKRLKDVAGPVQDLLNTSKRIQRKLGALKFQLPANLRANGERLKQLFKVIPATIPVAIEFNHASWFDENHFDCLRNQNAALVVNDANTRATSSPLATGPQAQIGTDIVTADWTYRHMTHSVYETLALEQLLMQATDSHQVRSMLFFTHANNGPHIASQFQHMTPKTQRLLR
jgi:uncharacterized protein YecE (DUF72 family)